MKKFAVIFLSFLLMFLMLPCAMATEATTETTEAVSYTAYPQGTLQNIAAGKPVRVTSVALREQETNTAGTVTRRVTTGGQNLTDERNETYWESIAEFPVRSDVFKNPQAGSFATVDLGDKFPIYRIELVGEKEALANYEIYGIPGQEWYAQGTRLMYNTSEGTNATVRTPNAPGNKQYDTRYLSTTEDDQEKLSVNYVNLYGDKYRMIRIQKTNGDAAKFAEIRVYGIEPKLIDVTPKAAHNLFCNDTVDSSYPLTQAVDGNPDTIAHPKKTSTSKHLHVNFDLGDKYFVRRTEYWPRQSISSVDDYSKRQFAIWTGNADSIEADITTSDTGTKIGGFGKSLSMKDDSVTGFGFTYAPGATTFVSEKTPTEATQYVTFEWTEAIAQGYTMAEFRIFAEDRTPENIEIVNIADFASKEELSNGRIRLDLGAYYNVKKVVANGNSGAFKIVGQSTTQLGYDDAILAASPTGFTAATEYDVEMQNVVRYVTFSPKSSTSTLSDLKIYAEKGKVYENISEGKTARAVAQANKLTDGIISEGNYAYGEHVYDVNVVATPANTINIDLGEFKTLDAISITFRKDNESNAWERNTFQIWGANEDDFSDKEIIASQGTRTTASGNVWTVIPDTPKAYRYLVMTTYSNGRPQELNDYLHYYGTPANSPTEYRANTTYYVDGSTTKVEHARVIQEIQVYTEKEDSVSDEVTVSSLNFTDKDGVRLPYAFVKEITPYVNLTLRKLGTLSKNVSLILAEYSDSGKLMNLDIKPIDTAEIEQFKTKTYTTKLDLTGESGTVKAFVFAENMEPLCEMLSYGNQSIFPKNVLDTEVTYQPITEVKDSNGAYYVDTYSEHNDSYDIDAIFYDGSVYKGKQTKVFAYIGIPKGASKENPVPAVVHIHGGGGSASKNWVKLWNDKGYAAIAMDLYGKGPDKVVHPYKGADPFDYSAFLKNFENAGMYQNVISVINAHNIIRSHEKVDANKTGVTGFSWGGVTTSIVCGVDNRFKFAAPVYGSGYLDYSRTYFQDYYKRADASDKWDPINFAATAKMPVLYVNGDMDINFSLDATSMSFEKTPGSYLCIKHAFGHSDGTGSQVAEIFTFAEKIFSGNQTPFIKIENTESKAGNIEFDVTIPNGSSISGVVVYYATCEEIPYGNAVTSIGWQSVSDYTINDNHITVTLPETAKIGYASVIDSDGSVISTPLTSIVQ